MVFTCMLLQFTFSTQRVRKTEIGNMCQDFSFIKDHVVILKLYKMCLHSSRSGTELMSVKNTNLRQKNLIRK